MVIAQGETSVKALVAQEAIVVHVVEAIDTAAVGRRKQHSVFLPAKH